MKIYEITSRIPNEQLIHKELTRLSNTINEDANAPIVAAGPGFLASAGAVVMKVLSAASWFFLLKPFGEFFYNMSTIEDNLKNDKSPDAEKRYHEELIIQIGMLVAAVAAGLLTKGVFGTVTGFLKLVKYIPVVGPIIANIISMLSAAAQVYVLKELASEEGRTAIANLLTGNILGKYGNLPVNGIKLIGDGVNDAIQFFSKVVNDALGQTTDKSATDKPEADKPEADKPDTAKPEADTAPAEKTASVAKDPDDLDWTPKPGEELYTPSNMKRSASGRLTL